MEQATARRLREELGVQSELTFLFRFQYQANFGEKGSENELCSVFVGKLDGEPAVNPDEIEQTRWSGIDELTAEMREHPERFTPWMKMEWERLTAEFRNHLPKK